MSGAAGMSRRTLRAALVVMTPGGTPRAIVFQYNPANLRRKLAPQMIGGDAQSRSSAMAYSGAPVETIDADVEIDAGDQEAFATAPVTSGIAPQLAAIEAVLYPPSAQVGANQRLLDAGTLEVGPYIAPTILFVWGSQRVVPVKIVGYSVTEEAFDAELNPMRASVSLNLQVLTYSDLPAADYTASLFMAYQVAKERLAAEGSANGSAVADLVGVPASSFTSAGGGT